jgi:NAD(P)-dependent dehydrogenase (short-subunit alcohol dehydrogenase family)
VQAPLEGTRIVVTGASRGIGRALAQAYAARGARLVLTATREEHLRAVLDACRDAGAAAEPVALDLVDPVSTNRAASRALAVLGRVDVLVNNAGILGILAPLSDYPLDLWEKVLAVNLTGTVRLTQRILPGMADGGAIVNLTSGAAGRPGRGAYGVSKLAIEGVTRMLREELGPRRIRCVAVNPGSARTDMRAAYAPGEDPATVPHPSAVVGPFLAIAAGEDPGWYVDVAAT